MTQNIKNIREKNIDQIFKKFWIAYIDKPYIIKNLAAQIKHLRQRANVPYAKKARLNSKKMTDEFPVQQAKRGTKCLRGNFVLYHLIGWWDGVSLNTAQAMWGLQIPPQWAGNVQNLNFQATTWISSNRSTTLQQSAKRPMGRRTGKQGSRGSWTIITKFSFYIRAINNCALHSTLVIR